MQNKKLFIPFLIFAIAIAGSIFAWQKVDRVVKSQEQETFKSAVEETSIRFESQLKEYINILYGARGLFSASENVERDEWKAYLESLNLQERFPGIQALSFIEIVLLEEKQDFISRIRSDTSIFAGGYPDFTIYPEEDREEYFVVNYIEPFLGNETAFGFNLGSNATRLKALENARDSGLPIATEPIRLVQETKEQTGFLVFLPLYKKDALINTSEEMTLASQGFISAVFRAEDIASSILNKIKSFENMRVEIIDLEANGKFASVYNNGGKIELDDLFEPQFTINKEVKVADRIWKLHFEELPEFIRESTESFLPIAVLITGLIFSFLLLGVLYSFSTSRDRALALAKSMTAESNKSKNDMQKALQKAKESKAESEEMNDAMVGREMKMIELKQEIAKLKSNK